ncbi:uncharacterized protein LOC121487909 [Vulpes lagopus]|uniref:uncharacterized protein LOC121487909 n=1 Tax=Vulpes lagopus TaxID=494514 RepID=UPI001BC91C42|nr:uncharacterized protein LOC121487909 [Vulpes lagopus]
MALRSGKNQKEEASEAVLRKRWNFYRQKSHAPGQRRRRRRRRVRSGCASRSGAARRAARSPGRAEAAGGELQVTEQRDGRRAQPILEPLQYLWCKDREEGAAGSLARRLAGPLGPGAPLPVPRGKGGLAPEVAWTEAWTEAWTGQGGDGAAAPPCCPAWEEECRARYWVPAMLSKVLGAGKTGPGLDLEEIVIDGRKASATGQAFGTSHLDFFHALWEGVAGWRPGLQGRPLSPERVGALLRACGPCSSWECGNAERVGFPSDQVLADYNPWARPLFCK